MKWENFESLVWWFVCEVKPTQAWLFDAIGRRNMDDIGIESALSNNKNSACNKAKVSRSSLHPFLEYIKKSWSGNDFPTQLFWLRCNFELCILLPRLSLTSITKGIINWVDNALSALNDGVHEGNVLLAPQRRRLPFVSVGKIQVFLLGRRELPASKTSQASDNTCCQGFDGTDFQKIVFSMFGHGQSTFLLHVGWCESSR